MARFQDIFRKWCVHSKNADKTCFQIFKYGKNHCVIVHIWIFRQSLHAPIFFDWIFLPNLIINSNQMLFRAAGFEVPQIPWLFAIRWLSYTSSAIYYIYPNGIVAVSFFKLLLSLHIGGCHRNGRALCFS